MQRSPALRHGNAKSDKEDARGGGRARRHRAGSRRGGGLAKLHPPLRCLQTSALSMRVLEGIAEVEQVVNEAPKPLELEAVRLFALYGSLARVSRELAVPLYELQKLSRTQWWLEEVALLQRAEAAETNAKLTRLWDMTLDQIEDRLTNGDFHVIGQAIRRSP